MSAFIRGVPRARALGAGLALGLLGVLACTAAGEEVEVQPSPPPEPTPIAGTGGTGMLPATEEPTPIFTEEQPPEPAEPPQCDKVDFLYVVDNSTSMADKQERLARSFLGFSAIVQDRLSTNDLQIMVVDTDARSLIDGYAETSDSCFGKLGAGLLSGGEGEVCGIDGAQRYMRDNQPDQANTFSCLARVGVFGDVDERPAEALLAATNAIDNDLGECNSGFLREDAVLVVTIITDEEDDQSAGDPEQWREQLLAIKGGNEDAIVMLGLLGDSNLDEGLPGGPCGEGEGFGSPRLQSFVESFEYGSLGSVCAGDYSRFFEAAVDPIQTACAQFNPR